MESDDRVGYPPPLAPPHKGDGDMLACVARGAAHIGAARGELFPHYLRARN
jgi:hypothetical protein